MKTILFILPSLTLGGLERVQVTLANALADKGYDVTVMVLENRLDLKNELDRRVHLIYKPYKPHKVMRRIPYIRHKFYDDGMWETRATPKKLYKYYIGNEKFDIEVGFFRGLAVKVISGSTNKASKKLAWVHSDFKLCGGVTNNFKSLEEVKIAYSKYDSIVCVSHQTEKSFNEVIGLQGKTVTIYNMLPVEKILSAAQEPINIEKNKFTVLSVGHLTEAKGYDRLIEAVKRLNQNGFDFDLWLVGYGEDEDKLKEYAKENELNNINFLGYQKNPYKYMKAADLYVCSSRYEGFNLTVAEALILETPVLSTDCTGPAEILDGGKYGMLVDNSTDGLYNGIRSFLSNTDLLDAYCQKAGLRKPFFDGENTYKKIINLFGENK
ncbi:MAG: glycosyltransferase [Clostridia bacterium]|nr:glycosyltransferase [Clostridia bacterium]MBR4910001.1 glycosyltransferase [Clostridia bacterium]